MNLLKSLAKISSMIFLSRILGFIRDVVVARVFGVSIATDAFFIALKLPNLLRKVFAEGAFSQAFIPILAEYKNKKGEEASRLFIAHVAGLLTLVLALISLIGVLAAPVIVWINAPGYAKTPERFDLTVSLLHITFPYILLISLSALCGSVLNMWNRFTVPAFVPSLLNVSMIIFALFVAPYCHPPIMALAWAIMLGGVLQLAYQLPFLKQIGMLVWPRLNIKDKGVWRVLSQMAPAILGVSVGQISLIINTIFASFLTAGSVSWLYYADRLMEFPAGVLGAALGTILLPAMSGSHAKGNKLEYSKLIDWGLKLSILLALPSAVALAVLSRPLIDSLFQYGHFNANDSLQTQYALIAYSFGVLWMILIKVLAPGFYSAQDMKTPVKIALMTLVVTQLMNLIFIIPFKHAGLALSISVACCFNAVLLFWQLRKKNIYQPQQGWRKFLFQVISATLFMAIVLVGVLQIMPCWTLGNMFHRLLRLGLVVFIGLLSYFIILFLTGFRVKNFIHRVE